MAQEREKRRIVIASILKPVDDTRMLEKIGLSLARKDGFAVSIIGYATTSPSIVTNIRLISLGHFPRLSLRRWMAKWVVLRKAWALQPTHFIFTTHELILPAIILKVARGTHIIYDVRENFYRNIRNSESLPWLARISLAMLVRFKEKLLAPTIDHFFLAEKAYEKEFRFHRGGWTVLENKALIPAGLTRTRIPGKTRLLFSGHLLKFPGVKLVIAHGGAALPYALGRLVRNYQYLGKIADPKKGFDALFFDSCVFDAATLEYLVKQASPGHVMLGSDMPFNIGDPNPRNAVEGAYLPEAYRRAILGETAQKVFRIRPDCWCPK